MRSGPGALSGFKPCSSFMIPFTKMLHVPLQFLSQPCKGHRLSAFIMVS